VVAILVVDMNGGLTPVDILRRMWPGNNAIEQMDDYDHLCTVLREAMASAIAASLSGAQATEPSEMDIEIARTFLIEQRNKHKDYQNENRWGVNTWDLAIFAARARAEEREQCAAILERRAAGFRGLGGESGSPIMNAKAMAEELDVCSAAIRNLT
jgi:hypothetical protein